MATLVQDNPFDVQQPKTADTGLVSGAMESPTASTTSTQTTAQPTQTATSTPAPQAPAPQTAQTSNLNPAAATYQSETRQVDPATQTVQGQVNSILAKDSPLMQRARTLATQQMAQRGLVNSSMAVGAGQAAMVDRALPMAQQDASAYNATAAENMAARNRAAEFNTGSSNQFGLQQDQQSFQIAQQTIQNDFNRQMQVLQESGLDFRQARDIASREAITRLEQMGIQNRFDQEIALKADQFNVEQYNAERRLIIENQAKFDQLGLQLQANTAAIPSNFAATISANAMQGVNEIMSSSLTDDQKRAAIDNIVGYANSQIAWGAKFYGTAIPAIGTPTNMTNTVYNPTAPTAYQTNFGGTTTPISGGPALLQGAY
jgi:hypothetical protein